MKVVIYSKPDCMYCTRAKTFFQSKNIKYQEIIVNEHLTMNEYTEITDMNTVPGIFINGIFIGGYTDLVEYVVDNPELF